MKLVEYIIGNAIKIVYLDCDSKHDISQFLDEIEKTRPKEFYSLTTHLDRTAKYGIVWNNYKTKRLQGSHAQPICEFCGHKEARIFWFTDENDDKLIVLTHGFIGRGKHDHRSDITRAQNRKTLYYELKQATARASSGQKFSPGKPA